MVRLINSGLVKYENINIDLKEIMESQDIETETDNIT